MLDCVRNEVAEALEYRSRLLSLCAKLLDEMSTIEQGDLLPKIRYFVVDRSGYTYYVMPGSSYVLSLDSNSFYYGNFETAQKCQLDALDNCTLESLLSKFNVSLY